LERRRRVTSIIITVVYPCGHNTSLSHILSIVNYDEKGGIKKGKLTSHIALRNEKTTNLSKTALFLQPIFSRDIYSFILGLA
jgi:hypothetical protein